MLSDGGGQGGRETGGARVELAPRVSIQVIHTERQPRSSLSRTLEIDSGGEGEGEGEGGVEDST